MSKKNRFQKYKSRKYRKLRLPSSGPTLEKLKPADIVEDVNLEEKSNPEPTKISTQTTPAGHFKPKQKIQNLESKDIHRQELKKVLTISAGFVILILGLYLLKIKTGIFDLTVAYLYKILSFSA